MSGTSFSFRTTYAAKVPNESSHHLATLGSGNSPWRKGFRKPLMGTMGKSMKCPNCGGFDILVWNHPDRCNCVRCSHCDRISYPEDCENYDNADGVLCDDCISMKIDAARHCLDGCKKNHLGQCNGCRVYIDEWKKWPDGLWVDNNGDEDQWHQSNHCHICRIVIDNTEPSTWPDGIEWSDPQS